MTEDPVLNVTRLRVLRELAARGSIAAVADALVVQRLCRMRPTGN